MKISAPSSLFLGELNDSPLGDFRLAASDLGLVALEWADAQPELDAYLQKLKHPLEMNQKKVMPYVRELREYLNGKRTAFTIPIDWSFLTPFHTAFSK